MEYYPGQRFDQWLKLTEDNLKGDALGIMRKLQHRARLFTFDDESFVAGADKLDTFEDLRTPFPVTALEIQSRVVCITDAEAASQWVVQSMLHGPDSTNIILGMFVDKTTYGAQVESASYFREGQFVGKFHDKERLSHLVDRYATDTLWLLKIALAILNCKDRFILEQSPLEEPRQRKKDSRKPRRSKERQTYTVIDPTTIRKRMKLVETGIKRRGHDVRGHWRVYRDDRYINMKGKSKWIEAHWAGPTENVVDGVRYRVRIDK